MKRTVLLLLTIFIAMPFYARWTPMIVNYDRNLYDFGMHTWQILPTDNQRVYFANSNGLLEKHADHWNVYRTHNGIDIRSILQSRKSDRIYIGGSGEFGYYQTMPNGTKQYVCLSDSLEYPFYDNIWSIQEEENVIYFQGEHHIVRCVDDELFLIEVGSKINSSSLVDGILYLGLEDGLYMLAGKQIFKKEGAEFLNDRFIRCLRPIEHGVMIATHEALFTYDGETLAPFHTHIQSYLKENGIFTFEIHGDTLVVGTIQGGAIIYDLKRHTHQIIDKDHGLTSHTVLSLCFQGDRLWLGQDGGITCVFFDYPFRMLSDPFKTLGAGYTSYYKDDILYLGTNTGLHYIQQPFSSQEHTIVTLPNAKGQVWQLQSFFDDVFSLQDLGLFHIQGTQAQRISHFSGVKALTPVPGDTPRAILVSNNKLFVIEKRQGVWKKYGRIEQFNGSPDALHFEAPNKLWAKDNQRIICYELSPDLRRIKAQENFPLPQDKAGQFFGVVQDTLFVSNQNHIFTLDSEKGMFLPNECKSQISSPHTYLEALTQVGDSWLYLEKESIYIQRPNQEAPRRVPFFNHMRMTSNACPPQVLGDSAIILPLETGFSFFEVTEQDPVVQVPRVVVESIHTPSHNDSLLYQYDPNAIQELELPYALNTLRFQSVIESDYPIKGVLYQYKIDDLQPWTQGSVLSIKEYSALSPGKYTFRVRAILPDQSVAETSFVVRIIAPWYLNTGARLVYFFLGLSLFYFVYRANENSHHRSKQRLISEKDAEILLQKQLTEQEKHEKEALILALEKEKVEHELRHKSQELANMMVSSTNKNSTFVQVREDVQKLKRLVNKDPNSLAILQEIEERMNSNITSDDLLQRIEDEFDLVHDRFIKHLEKKHPDLNYNERMMCTYLKMGLSSKEIAPMLNISTRGVETLRYRLRKKFNIERSESLKIYLQTEIIPGSSKS